MKKKNYIHLILGYFLILILLVSFVPKSNTWPNGKDFYTPSPYIERYKDDYYKSIQIDTERAYYSSHDYIAERALVILYEKYKTDSTPEAQFIKDLYNDNLRLQLTQIIINTGEIFQVSTRILGVVIITIKL